MDCEQLYDRQTGEIMRRALGTTGTLVDVGCHEGKFMDLALELAPATRHFGFEPLPDYAARLVQRYARHPNVTILDLALSDTEGEATFVHNVDIPSHSGLRERSYPIPDTRRETITVRTRRLDDLLPPVPVAMIKIDVEGAELLVLRGARETLRRWKPAVVFEFGIGAANHYGHGPRDIHALFSALDMGVFTLDAMLDGGEPLTLPAFEDQYSTPRNYYFGARALHPAPAATKPSFLQRVRRLVPGAS
jgi:FkbM family methyltransferase